MEVFGCEKHGECLLTERNLTRQLTSERRIRKACELCKDYSEVQSVQLSGAGLLVGMAYCEKDADRAIDLLNWCAELSGRQERSLLLISPIQDGEHSEIREAAGRAFSEVIAITTPYQLADESWPRGPNWMFRTALEALRDTDRPFYWLEPDCFPIAPDWLDRIEAEYATCGKPFMGAVVGSGKTAQHMTGCGIYPPGALKLLREFTDGSGAWDYVSRDKVVPLCHHSRQFFHFWSRDTGRSAAVNEIPPYAAIGHQCKTGDVIRQLRARPKIVYTYFEPIAGFDPSEELAVIDLWRDSWEAHGWTCQVLGREDAERHPRFAELAAIAATRPTVNPAAYEMACYLRWLAIAMQPLPGLVSDYDVMNLGFERASYSRPTRIGPSLTGVFLPSHAAAESIVDLLCQPFAPVTWAGKPHMSDMFIIERNWNSAVDDGSGCIYGEGKGKLVHFPNRLCPAGMRKAAWIIGRP